MNNFLAGGGDGFSAFTRQRDAMTGPGDIDAFEAWLKGATPRAVPQEERTVDAAAQQHSLSLSGFRALRNPPLPASSAQRAPLP